MRDDWQLTKPMADIFSSACPSASRDDQWTPSGPPCQHGSSRNLRLHQPKKVMCIILYHTVHMLDVRVNDADWKCSLDVAYLVWHACKISPRKAKHLASCPLTATSSA
jgi:hypothetical protein